MSEENLKKGLMGPLAAGLMTVSAMSPKLQEAFDRATSGVVTPPKPIAQFKPDTLHPDMHGIAFLETSYGKNMNHAAHPKGDFDTAYGPLGFKPSTAFDEFSKNKHLTQIYPDLVDKAKFINEFKANPDFYNLVAGTHWNRLKKNTGTANGAAFAWRWGLTAFKQAKPEVVDADDYVKKYTKATETKAWAPQPAKPAKPMAKNEAWKPMDRLSEADRIAQGYQVSISDQDGLITATLTKSEKVLASIGGVISGSDLIIQKAEMDFGIKGAGFGRILLDKLSEYSQPLIKKLKEADLNHFPEETPAPTINHHLTPESPHRAEQVHFESHINKPDHTPAVWSSPVDPFADNGWDMESHTGDSKKSIFNFDGKKTLMKAATHSDPHTHEGFSEALSQALYHAAGEGDLVQKSHLSHINGRHFLVVHMDPEAKSFHHFQEDLERDHSKPISEHYGMDLLQRNNVIREQAKKIGLMDYLTSNADRNSGNIMVKRNKSGRPDRLLAIDHGNAFETQTENPVRVHPDEGMHTYLAHGPITKILHSHSFMPNHEWSKALQWVHENSQKMSREVEKHVAAIQDPVIKQTVLDVFHSKLGHLQRMHRMIRDGFWPEDENLVTTTPSQSLVHYNNSYNETQNHPSVRP